MANNDIAKKVTQIVIDGLKKGHLVWKKSWKSAGLDEVPMNYKSKKRYHGSNVIVLSVIQLTKGYTFNKWVTYKGALDLGGNVIKGEKGYPVVFWKFFESKVIDDAGDEQIKRFPMLRYFTVFNLDQCEGFEKPEIPKADEDKPLEVIKSAEKIVSEYDKREKNLSLNVKASDRAYYSPREDMIVAPLMEQFVEKAKDELAGKQSFYKTLFHEIVHSTGHSERLNREKGMRAYQASTEYSKEELVAEMGASMLGFKAGITNDDNLENAQAYINGWIKRLEENPDWIIWAGGRAEKAMNYVLDGSK